MRGGRAAGRLRRSRVVATRHVTPRMLRLTLAGDLDDFEDQGTDQHVAVYVYPPEAVVPDALTREALDALHEFALPQVRRYTVRRWDPVRREVEVDVVVHSPPGLASGLAQDLDVGDDLLWWGPTPSWRAPASGTLVLVADESGLPAVDAILLSLPSAVRAVVVAEVADAREERYLAHHAGVDVTWVHRGDPRGEVVPGVVEALRAVGEGAADGGSALTVWAGTEFATAGHVRRWAFGDLGLDHADAFVVTYWTYGRAQDARPDARNQEATRRRRLADPDRAREHWRPVGTAVARAE